VKTDHCRKSGGHEVVRLANVLADSMPLVNADVSAFIVSADRQLLYS
jgi:hypothetical protein